MKIALIGYGKMGRMIEQIAIARNHEIVCIIDVDNQEDFDSEAFASADVAIEFTSPTAAYGNYLRAFSHLHRDTGISYYLGGHLHILRGGFWGFCPGFRPAPPGKALQPLDADFGAGVFVVPGLLLFVVYVPPGSSAAV